MSLLNSILLAVFAYCLLVPLVVLVLAMIRAPQDSPPRSRRYPSGPPHSDRQCDPGRTRYAPDDRQDVV